MNNIADREGFEHREVRNPINTNSFDGKGFCCCDCVFKKCCKKYKKGKRCKSCPKG